MDIAARHLLPLGATACGGRDPASWRYLRYSSKHSNLGPSGPSARPASFITAWTRAAASRIRSVATHAVEIAQIDLASGGPVGSVHLTKLRRARSNSSSAACNIREIDASRSPRAGTIMKLAVATLAVCTALAPAPQRPQTRRALLAKSGIAGLSLAGPLVALLEAANAVRLQDMAAAREAKKSGGKKAAAAPKARRPRQKSRVMKTPSPARWRQE